MACRHSGSVFGDLGLTGLVLSVGLFYGHRPSFGASLYSSFYGYLLFCLQQASKWGRLVMVMALGQS